MYFNNLYDEILVFPLVDNRLNRLLIVSGYATAAMSFRYLNHLREMSREVDIQLIVGMTARDGLTSSNHSGFKHLVNNDFHGRFMCSYVVRNQPVHSKIYVWCNNNEPLLAFTGSANYTQTAFCLNNQLEAMTLCNHIKSADYFHSLLSETVYCNHPEADQLITIYRDNVRRREYEIGEADEAEFTIDDYIGLPSVTISFLDRHGELPQRSGLNWGQRRELSREPNQAYIRIPSSIYHTNFFPPRSVHFTVLTDDGKTLICTRAQANGKGIQTPHNNSLIGEYFRNRLGVGNGEPIHTEDLIQYGRTDVSFYKIDDETYYMNFAS